MTRRAGTASLSLLGPAYFTTRKLNMVDALEISATSATATAKTESPTSLEHLAWSQWNFDVLNDCPLAKITFAKDRQ